MRRKKTVIYAYSFLCKKRTTTSFWENKSCLSDILGCKLGRLVGSCVVYHNRLLDLGIVRIILGANKNQSRVTGVHLKFVFYKPIADMSEIKI